MNIFNLKTSAVNHVTETLWWNKGLTKLDEDVIANHEEFLQDLVRVKGPYLEKVQPPQFVDSDWQDYCAEHDLHTDIEVAVRRVIFGGESGRLYKHQEEAVDEILRSARSERGNDTIITVPTATGKTECFVIPALQKAVETSSEDEFPRDIKSLIIYPQKALETDQLERLVEYTYHINKNRASRDEITIGIYDGDTPRGQFEFSNGQNVRGLTCPVCGEKLEWDQDASALICRNQSEHRRPVKIDFLEVTRNQVEANGADILITNPEALEFRFYSSDARDLIDSDSLDLVVFDEAHVWQGNGGRAVSYFISRLRQRYDPSFVLASATIANPTGFAEELLSRDQFSIKHVDYRPGLIPDTASSDDRFTLEQVLPPREGFRVLQAVQEGMVSPDELGDRFNVSEDQAAATLDFLERIGYIDAESVTRDGREILDELEEYGDLSDIRFQALFNQVIPLKEDLSERLLHRVPHTVRIFDEFGEDDFVDVDALLKTVFDEIDPESRFKVFDSLVEWCKLAGILYDRYHYFLKPYANFFYCSDCNQMFTEEMSEVPGDDHSLHTVQFCSNCHTPYFVENDDLYAIHEACTCSGQSGFTEPRMRTSTFLSYMLSQLGRDIKEVGAGKVLVFSNRRGDAESVGSLMMKLDYSLESERMMVNLLEEERGEGFYSVEDLRQDLYEKLKEVYVTDPYTYLNDETLSQGLFRQLGSFANPLNKENHRKLFSSGILSVKPVADDSEINFIANEIVKVLAFKPHRDLDQGDSIKEESLKQKLSNSAPTYFSTTPDLSAKVEEATSALADRDIVSQDREQVNNVVVDILNLRRNFLQLQVQRKAKICEFCHAGWPFWEQPYCPDCGKHLVDIDRDTDSWTEADGGFALDHWGRVVMGKEESPLVSAVHKAGIQTDTRNKVEEGFSADPPSINIVSATNTLELGIDIGTLDCIVGLGIPPTKTSYTQRSGRTGRNLDRSSVIFTVARPHNAVDNFYFEGIEDRFLNADPKPVTVNHLSYDVLKTQVMSETLAYLNRNELNYGAFERFETHQDVESVLQEIYEGVQVLLDTVENHQHDIIDYLVATFDGEDEAEVREAVEDLFDSPSELEQKVLRRLYKFYSSFQALESESGKGVNGIRRRRVIQEELLQELEQEIGYFPMLLSQAGLVSQYRSTEDSVALFREEEGEDNRTHLSYESKSVSQAMRESYPEAMDTYGGVDYEVVSAQVGRTSIFTSNICMNLDCLLPFNDYPKQLNTCPLCGDDLEAMDVHDYLGAILQSSRSRKRTRPFVMRGVNSV